MSAHPPAFAALRHRNFRLFFFGYLISLVGIWMQRVAQAWLVLDLTGSAFYVGLVEALGSLPVLVFTLYAGAVVDRVSKHRLVIATQVAAMLLSLTFAALVYTGHVAVGWIMAIAALLGVATAFDIPARQSFFGELVGKDDLMSAIALNASAFSVTRAVGPAIAGLLIAAFGVGLCFLLNGLSYLAVLVALFAMRLPPFRPAAAMPPTWATIADGLRYVAGNRRMRALIVNVAILAIFGIPVLVLLPILAKNVLGRGAVEYGWMMSAVGGGAVIGALGLAAYTRPFPKGKALGVMGLAFGICVSLIGLVRSLPLMLALLVATGLTMIVTTALTNTLLQTTAPDALRGRVISVYTLAFVGMSPFGALQAGTLADRLGPGPALILGGVVCVLTTFLAIWRNAELQGTT